MNYDATTFMLMLGVNMFEFLELMRDSLYVRRTTNFGV
jgi:hypothetical protein